MALMTSMRERMPIVLWFLIIMFLLSMSIGGMVGGANIIDLIFGRVNPSDAIGVVNGTPITPDEFTQAVNLRVEQYRSNGQEPDERAFHSIRNEIWDNYVQDILVYDQIEQLGLTATNEEVLYHLQNFPPSFIQQDPTFSTDGVFDQQKYLSAINNPQGNEWVQIEQFMKNTYVPNFKLQQYISSGVVITNEDVRKQYIKENVDYTIEGIHVMGQRMKDDVPDPTEDELMKAYQDDLESFTKDETRSIRFVSWKKSPTERDTLRVKEEAMELLDRARKESDFAKLANVFTEDPGNQVTPDSGRGGDLGWFGKGQMVPEFDEAAFDAQKGDIVGPVLSRFGYHIIKVNNKRSRDGKDEINASHILLQISMGSLTREEIRREATRFSYDAQDYGFDAALDTHQVTATEAHGLTELGSSVQGLVFMRSAVQFAFADQTDIGSVSERLENDNFYVVAVMDSISSEGINSLEAVKQNLTRQVTVQKQRDSALEMATKVRDRILNGESLTDMVSDDNRLELLATDKKKLQRGFNSIGRSHAVIGALLNSDIGEVVGPLETARGFCVIRLLAVSAVDSTDLDTKESEIYSTLVDEAQQDAFELWMKDLKDNAEIVDNRRYYY